MSHLYLVAMQGAPVPHALSQAHFKKGIGARLGRYTVCMSLGLLTACYRTSKRTASLSLGCFVGCCQLPGCSLCEAGVRPASLLKACC